VPVLLVRLTLGLKLVVAADLAGPFLDLAFCFDDPSYATSSTGSASSEHLGSPVTRWRHSSAFAPDQRVISSAQCRHSARSCRRSRAVTRYV
jgi:hypothetical protein